MNGVNGHSEDVGKDAAPKASLRLGFSEYRRISNLLVLHLRKAEEGKDCLTAKKAEPEFREQLLSLAVVHGVFTPVETTNLSGQV